MKRYSIAIFLFGATLLLGAIAIAGSPQLARNAKAAPRTQRGGTVAEADEALPPGVVPEQVTTAISQPVAMAFDPAGRLFLAKRGGAVRLIEGGALQAAPVITFSVDTCYERGLVGLAVDPDFAENHYLYVQYTAFSNCDLTLSTVARFVEHDGVGSDPVTIFTTPFRGTYHSGNNIHFGPDGKLYVSTGDNSDASNGQNVTVPLGKMHRINPDGSIPADNPVFTQTGALSSLYAFGLRNSFDFTFDKVVTGRIFATENGPSCDDELNRVEAGWDYGWRGSYPCDDPDPGGPDPAYNTIAPLWYVPLGLCCLAPTGVEVYSGTMIPEWQNELFMCTYADGVFHHMYLSEDRLTLAGSARVDGVECNMDIETAPDGSLYYIQGGGVYYGLVMRLARDGGLPTATATIIPTTETPTTGPTNTPTSSATRTVTSTPTACTLEFEDVPPGSTFYSYVRLLACKQIVSGYPCGGEGEPCNGNSDPYFRPGENVSRGQLAKIVSNAVRFNDPTGFAIFQDVPEATSPFFIWVQRLANRGVMSGYPCGGEGEPCVPPGNKPYFRPGAQATRGQIAKIVANAAGYGDPPGDQRFEDVLPGSTFYDFVQRLASRGAIGGYQCGGPGEPCVSPDDRPYFRAANNATRGQVSKIVSEVAGSR